jgi:hypothetical protein
VAGLGARGKVHLKGLIENPDRFEIVGIYDPAKEAVNKTKEMFKLDCVFLSAEEIMEGAYYSALTNKRVDLPIQYGDMDSITEMKKMLPVQGYTSDMLKQKFFGSKSGSHITD